jgi:hypothetical protein
MTDRVVVFHPDDPSRFIVDACAALADAVNETRLWRDDDSAAIAVYAELVVALATVKRPDLVADSSSSTQLAINDHLVGRIRQAQRGELVPPLLDIVDRLHAELVREPNFA